MSSQPDNLSRDPRLPSEPLKTYTGSFEDIRLDVTPEEPLPPEARYSSIIVLYPLEPGYLHVILDGTNATELVPSGCLYLILVQLSAGLSDLFAGQAVTANWVLDPWQMEIKSNPKLNQAIITLHVPRSNWVAMRDVSVPLDQLGREALNVSKRWLEYLDTLYHAEILDPERGQSYRNSERILEEQQQALREYEMG